MVSSCILFLRMVDPAGRDAPFGSLHDQGGAASQEVGKKKKKTLLIFLGVKHGLNQAR